MSAPVTVPPVHPEGDVPIVQRRPRVFAVLTNFLLCPGIGHFFVGRRLAGVLWAGGSMALIIAAPIHPWLTVAGLLMTRPLSAMEVARGPVRYSDRNRTVPWVVAGLLVAFGSWFAVRTYYLEAFKIPSVGMVPALQAGDHLFVNKLAYRLGDVARGDLAVFWDPCEPKRAMIERVIGLPGDSVEVRCDIVYLNGRALPQKRLDEKAGCSYWEREDWGGWHRVPCTRYSEVIDGVSHDIIQSQTRPAADLDRAEATSYQPVAGEHDFPHGRVPSCEQFGMGDARPPAGRIEKAVAAAAAALAPGSACSPSAHYLVPEGHIFVMGDNRDNSSDSRAWGPVPLDLVFGRVLSVWWSAGGPEEGIRWSRIGAIH